MIAKTPEERQLYEDRLKAERDEYAKLAQARLEGRDEGLVKGEMIGKISLLQEMLGQQPAERNTLLNMTTEQLLAIRSDLQKQLQHRS